VALGLLAAGHPERGATLAKAQFDSADNMTDRQSALTVLASLDAPEREQAFASFYDRFESDSLVLDKWFALQAAAQRADTIDVVEALAGHSQFTARNPNRWRALVSNFAANQWAFHHASGRGYRFVSDMILAVDRINPQVAARQVPSLGRWKRFELGRAEKMRAELERIVATPGLSKDVFEQASKSLS
jgi:aminopeptidase N